MFTVTAILIELDISEIFEYMALKNLNLAECTWVLLPRCVPGHWRIFIHHCFYTVIANITTVRGAVEVFSQRWE